MREQSGQDVVRVLPYGLGHDELGPRVDAGEDAHAFFLRTDEAVLFVFLVRMGADQLVAGLGHGLGQQIFHFFLLRPTSLVGREAQIAAGRQEDLSFADFGRFHELGDIVLCHEEISLECVGPIRGIAEVAATARAKSGHELPSRQ